MSSQGEGNNLREWLRRHGWYKNRGWYVRKDRRGVWLSGGWGVCMKSVDSRRLRVTLLPPGDASVCIKLTIGGSTPAVGTEKALMGDLKYFLKLVTGKDTEEMVPTLVGIPWASDFIREYLT